MKNKKLIIPLVALVALVAVMVGIYFATRPQPNVPTGTTDPSSSAQAFAKTVTVIVTHKDGTEKTFTYQTNEAFLGPVLYAEGLIAESASAGMFDTVDGEKADWGVDQSYWALYIGDDYAMTGVDTTPISDGDVFKLVYTCG